jgi:hypothetical protein
MKKNPARTARPNQKLRTKLRHKVAIIKNATAKRRQFQMLRAMGLNPIKQALAKRKERETVKKAVVVEDGVVEEIVAGDKIPDTAENWENGLLGTDPASQVFVPLEDIKL